MRESRRGKGAAENKIHYKPIAKLSKKNIWNHPLFGKHVDPSDPPGKKNFWIRVCSTTQYMYITLEGGINMYTVYKCLYIQNYMNTLLHLAFYFKYLNLIILNEYNDYVKASSQ